MGIKRIVEKFNVRVLPFAVIALCAAITGCGKPVTGDLLRLVPFLSVTLFGIAYLAGRTRRILIVYCSAFAVFALIFLGTALFEWELGNEGFYFILVIQSFIVYGGIAHGIGSYLLRKYQSGAVASLIVPAAVSIIVTGFYFAVVILNADDNGEIGELTIKLFGGLFSIAMMFD